jgi:hypothetical protein
MSRRIVNAVDRVPFPRVEVPYEAEFRSRPPDAEHIYDICIAVPRAGKHFVWFTWRHGRPVGFVLEIDRHTRSFDLRIRATLAVPEYKGRGDTVVFGSVIGDEMAGNSFIVEDLCLHYGEFCARVPFGEKLHRLCAMMASGALRLPLQFLSGDCVGFAMAVMLPLMISVEPATFDAAEAAFAGAAYPICRYQYRSSAKIAPCLNRGTGDFRRAAPAPAPAPMPAGPQYIQSIEGGAACGAPGGQKVRINPRRGQYKQRTVFRVSADPQHDIYRLFAQPPGRGAVQFYDIAGVSTLRTSMFLNSLFRRIRENIDLDLAEESDDEDTFQCAGDDKYLAPGVSMIDMECDFDTRTRRWIPVAVAPPGARLVLMSALV